MPVKFDTIVSAVRKLQDAVTAWEQAPDDSTPLVKWRGIERKSISAEVEQTAAELFDLVNTMAVENTLACQVLVLAIDRFDKAFCDWAIACQNQPDALDPSGTPDVWHSYGEMIEATTPKQFTPPEPPAALASLKGMTPQQIAKTFGWKLPNGEPDVAKVHEELASPGKHFNPAKWIHPKMLKLKAETDVLWERRAAVIGSKQERHAAVAAPESAPRIEAESVEDFIAKGVNSRQIAKYTFRDESGRPVKYTEQQIREKAAEIGFPIDGNAVSEAFYRQTRAQEEEQRVQEGAEAMRLARIDTHPDLGDATSRILAMHADGVPHGDIAKCLTAAQPGLTHQKVGKVVRDAAKTTAGAT